MAAEADTALNNENTNNVKIRQKMAKTSLNFFRNT